MKGIEIFKKYILKKEFNFETMIFRGKFTVIKIQEKKLPYTIYDYDDKKSDLEYNITVNLNKCEWWSISNTWISPRKGFRKNKIIANKHIRVIIEKEVKSMMSILGLSTMINEIKINWLHED